jgi:hypothetical protein
MVPIGRAEKRKKNSPMDVEQFVSLSLNQIMNGVIAAQNTAKSIENARVNTPLYVKTEEGKFINFEARTTEVQFDIAVTTSVEAGSEFRAGILVASFGAGADRTKSSSSQAVSRLKFSVFITCPTQSLAKAPEMQQG